MMARTCQESQSPAGISRAISADPGTAAAGAIGADPGSREHGGDEPRQPGHEGGGAARGQQAEYEQERDEGGERGHWQLPWSMRHAERSCPAADFP